MGGGCPQQVEVGGSVTWLVLLWSPPCQGRELAEGICLLRRPEREEPVCWGGHLKGLMSFGPAWEASSEREE